MTKHDDDRSCQYHIGSAPWPQGLKGSIGVGRQFLFASARTSRAYLSPPVTELPLVWRSDNDACFELPIPSGQDGESSQKVVTLRLVDEQGDEHVGILTLMEGVLRPKHIATGPLCMLQVDGRSLAEVVVGKILKAPVTRPILEGRDYPFGHVTACGASVFNSRRSRGLPTYLDMLPKLESLVVRRGEPLWEDLLHLDDRYVQGGERMVFRPRDLNLQVRKEEKQIKLSVWREGHPTVREVEVAFPKPVPKDTPVGLTIEIVAGQGNPRIEVIPADLAAFGGRRLYLDWRRATETSRTRDEEVELVPRTNPPLEPRLASMGSWCGGYWQESGARQVVRKFLDGYSQLSIDELKHRLEIVKKALWEKDPDYAARAIPDHATAVSSDGRLHTAAPDDQVFARLISLLDELRCSSKQGPVRDEAARILGYCSVDTPAIRSWIEHLLRSPETIDQAELVVIGNCLRDASEVPAVASAMLSNFRADRPGRRNDWMRAMCRILQYRDSGAEFLDSGVCLHLSKHCLSFIQEQIREGHARYLYRHASLCIVYLLRRRRWDDGYLAPDSGLAEEIKATFREAIAKFKADRLKAIGGFVDLPHVTQMMIDYIDRRGKGRLVGLSVGD